VLMGLERLGWLQRLLPQDTTESLPAQPIGDKA
jgi:hypothetical protein